MAALNPKFFTKQHLIVFIGLSVVILIVGMILGHVLTFNSIVGYRSFPQVNGMVTIP